tara:strand:+ start:4521 stop:8732 length:4212 start_codon:yes stop_codon:yes gene_type:complete
LKNQTNQGFLGKAHEGAMYSSTTAGEGMKRIPSYLIVFFLLTSCPPIAFVSASGEPSSFNTFSGGLASVDVSLQGNVTNDSAELDIPRNVTFVTSGFQLNVESQDESPGQIWIDVGEDGTYEWEFTGTGYGDIGSQNQFYDGSEFYILPSPSGNSTTPGVLIPSSATLQSSSMEASFSPRTGGGFFQIGEYQQVIETDVDGDGNPEPMFLLTIQSNNSTSIVWADWNSSSGITISNPVQTCDNATSLSVGDINGDGNEDIVAFSTQSGHACVHIANGTSFDPVVNSTVTNGLVKATLGDIDADGADEILSINSGGILAFQSWNNTTAGLSAAVGEMITPNGSVGMPALLISLHVGDFFGSGNESMLVMDSSGHWSLWQYRTGALLGPIVSFDDISRDEILTDLDGDGDIDIVGSNDTGFAFRINNGTTWQLNSQQGQVNFQNSTIVDFDKDGVLELLSPVSAVSDGSPSTIDGNISIREINSTNISLQSSEVLEPWSMPNSILTMDLDGDGAIEHVVSAGESARGVFIGGWHSIELDADGDGNPEMSRTGYAGDSSNGLSPLLMIDDADGIRDDLAITIPNLPTTVDGYGVSMVNVSMNISTTGEGDFNFSNLEISYDCQFFVGQNPHLIGNLTNSLNQQMTGGVGNLTIKLPINSTKAGNISLTNFFATTIPGAPNFATPITPVLSLVTLNETMVEFRWNDPVDYGEDFIEFEIFRLESSTESVDLLNVYNSTVFNETIDSNVEVGATYWYLVRSAHLFGISSNLSSPLQVTIPYPPPPGALTGLVLTDVAPDQGGELELTWDHSTDEISGYEVYLQNSSFTSTAGLTPFTLVSSSSNSTILSGLNNGQGYWATVVAVDQYGNKTEEVVPVGPAYPRNDDPSVVNLELVVSSTTSVGSAFSLEIKPEVDGEQIIPAGDILISMETSIGTYPISTNWDLISLSDFLDFGPEFSGVTGDVVIWANYSGYPGDEQSRPISPSSTSSVSTVTVKANFTSTEDNYELDWENETSVRVDLTAQYQSQQQLLDGSEFIWTAYNNSTGAIASGTGVIQDGFNQFIVNFSESGILFINLTGNSWIDADTSSLQIPLLQYGSSSGDNDTQNNQTNQEPWSPDSMLDVTLDCGLVIIDPTVDQELNCLLTNPNNYSLEVSLEADGWSEWPDYILFEPTAGQGDFILEGFESKNIEIRVDLMVEDFANSGLPTGLMEVDLRQGPYEYTSPGDRPITFEIRWNLADQPQVVIPDPEDNNTNQSITEDKKSTSDNTMLILGSVGAVAVVCLIAFIVIRMRNSDFEDWEEDDLDMEPDVMENSRVSKPLPVGVALDEIEDRTIIDESPDRPDFINEFDEDEAVSQNYSDNDDAEYYETESDNSGITTDEHGTEWYEDEVGVWWFRDPGEDDWSEFVE